VVPHSLWSSIAEIARTHALRDLDSLSSPPEALKPLIISVVNTNVVFLQATAQGIHPTQSPTQPPAPPSPGLASPSGGSGGAGGGSAGGNGGDGSGQSGAQINVTPVGVICSQAGCPGYASGSQPPWACQHVLTVPCNQCNVLHCRTGPRKWTCAQAKGLLTLISNPRFYGHAFKMSYSHYVNMQRRPPTGETETITKLVALGLG
jgi:hypothetical protein